MKTEEAIKIMAKSYYELLIALKPVFEKNEKVKIGLREGLTKFLSNLYINLRSENGKYDTDYYSEEAWNHKNDGTALIYEHIVPKSKYIQEPCEEACMNGKFKDGTKFSEEAILHILEKYWKVATITAEEDESLNSLGLSRKMPEGWQLNSNPFLRYEKAGIILVDENGKKVKDK